MLSRFTVGNFLSFKKPQTFSMIAGSVQKHKERLYQANDMKLLKFSAIYGANAAGKSNLVKAMEYARNVIVLGTEKISDAAFFKLDQTYQKIPSYFEFEICIEGVMYGYGFEILLSEKEITEEWLIRLGESRNDQIFSRNTITGNYDYDNSLFSSEENRNRFDIYINDLNNVKDTLFLQDIVTNKEALYNGNTRLVVLKEVFTWISALDISFPLTQVQMSFHELPIVDLGPFLAGDAEAKRAVRSRMLERRNREAGGPQVGNLAAVLRAWAPLRLAGAVTAYAAVAGEPDLTPIIEDMVDAGRPIALPRFSRERRAYELAYVEDLARDVSSGHLGIPEPVAACRTMSVGVANAPTSVWLVPGLAFDRAGNRLGRGAGHYDRLLADAQGVLVGIAHRWQIVEALPHEAHDVRMHWLATGECVVACV